MLCSIKIREDLENLNVFVSVLNQVKDFRLQDKLGQQNFHEDMQKVIEPIMIQLKLPMKI